MHKEIGKIQAVVFGRGGYQDAMIGFTFKLGSDKTHWGTMDFWGTWGHEPDKHTKWTKGDQQMILGESTMRVAKLMQDAKVESLDKLVGKPIEAFFDGICGPLKEWRIMTEVV